MTAHSIDFATTTLPQADITSRSGPKVVTALICESALMSTGLQHILIGTPFASASIVTVTGPDLHREMTEPPALVIWAANLSSGQMPLIKQVKEHFPEARLVALADHFDLAFVQQGLDVGVNGFCLTGSNPEVLITSLELVMLGESVLHSNVVRSLLGGVALRPGPKPQNNSPARLKPATLRPSSLSAREAEILGCLMGGSSNKIIARNLDVAEATVKVHVKAILRKIGVANRTQAAMWAMDHLPATREASLHG